MNNSLILLNNSLSVFVISWGSCPHQQLHRGPVELWDCLGASQSRGHQGRDCPQRRGLLCPHKGQDRRTTRTGWLCPSHEGQFIHISISYCYSTDTHNKRETKEMDRARAERRLTTKNGHRRK